MSDAQEAVPDADLGRALAAWPRGSLRQAVRSDRFLWQRSPTPGGHVDALYDVVRDPGLTHNIIDAHPDEAARAWGAAGHARGWRRGGAARSGNAPCAWIRRIIICRTPVPGTAARRPWPRSPVPRHGAAAMS